MFPRAVRLATIRGVQIRIDPSWIVMALLVTYVFWDWFRSELGHLTGTALAMAVAGALLFFASVVAHELAHALEAKHRGVEVGAITLFLLGGVTETKFDVKRPRDEFALAAIGPYVSLVAAALFGLVSAGAGWFESSSTGVQATLDAVADTTGVLGWTNLGLAAFNMLPGAPLDGGRVLRAAIWAVTKDRARSVRAAARAGQLLGTAVVALGLYLALARDDVGGGLWLAFIGWFLVQGASTELRTQQLRTLLGDRTAGSLAAPPRSISRDATIGRAAALLAAEPSLETLLVVDDERVGVAVLTLDHVVAVPAAMRADERVRDHARAVNDVPQVAPTTPLLDVLDQLDQAPAVLVVDGATPVGIVSRRQLAAALERSRQLDASPPRVPRRRR